MIVTNRPLPPRLPSVAGLASKRTLTIVIRRTVIIAYDVRSDSVRRRMLRVLREWRLDGQKSVHECRLTDTEAQELFLQLAAEIDSGTDRLMLAWVSAQRAGIGCGHCQQTARSGLLWRVS